MRIWELVLIALSLSMDAFAVALCNGLNMRKINYFHAFVIALFFGVFQAAMPLLGWALCKNFSDYIVNFDHWIAFALLAAIGANMIREALKKDDEVEDVSDEKLHIGNLFLMAVATSIDALAVGVTFAFLQIKIAAAVSLIGSITFALSFLGVVIGNKFGAKFKHKAEIAGGIILILIGLKILLEHLGVIAF